MSRIISTRVKSKPKNDFTWKNLLVPAFVMLAFWGIALWGWLASGYTQPLVMFGYIGTALGVGLGLYGHATQKAKTHRPPSDALSGRAVPGGVCHFYGPGKRADRRLFLRSADRRGADGGHPLLHRQNCGSAVVWAVMVRLGMLDGDGAGFFCPSSDLPGRLPGKWGWLRYLHFGLSLAIVLVLVFVVGYRQGATGAQAVTWFIAGNAAYYAIGIGLAYVLRG